MVGNRCRENTNLSARVDEKFDLGDWIKDVEQQRNATNIKSARNVRLTGLNKS